jgi:hypothetical protein
MGGLRRLALALALAFHNGKHPACTEDFLFIYIQKTVGERHASALLLYGGPRHDPIAHFGGLEKLAGQTYRDQAHLVAIGCGYSVADGAIGDRNQQAAVRDAPKIAVLGGNTQRQLDLLAVFYFFIEGAAKMSELAVMVALAVAVWNVCHWNAHVAKRAGSASRDHIAIVSEMKMAGLAPRRPVLS